MYTDLKNIHRPKKFTPTKINLHRQKNYTDQKNLHQPKTFISTKINLHRQPKNLYRQKNLHR
jgi:hypothetical protein